MGTEQHWPRCPLTLWTAPRALKVFCPVPPQKLLQTPGTAPSPAQALALGGVELLALRCSHNIILCHAGVRSDVSEASRPQEPLRSHADLCCSEPAPGAHTSGVCFPFLGWGEEQWQWPADSAFFQSAEKRDSSSLQEPSPGGLELRRLLSQEEYGRAMPWKAPRASLTSSIPSFPSLRIRVPRLAGATEVIAHHKGFSISPGTSVQDLREAQGERALEQHFSTSYSQRTTLCSATTTGFPLPPSQRVAALQMFVNLCNGVITN